MDITQIILDQHQEQRRRFALLDEIPREDTQALADSWAALVKLLEVHAAAEERHFYPHLLAIGQGPPQEEGTDPAPETKDAIGDHNEIRDGIRQAARHDVGSDGWWEGVYAAREANSDHMGEEEREDLPDFRLRADLELRHDLALKFLAFFDGHPDGVDVEDSDPDAYVEEHG